MTYQLDQESLESAYPVPAHIRACARALSYDLLHGPAWACVPPEGIEAFTADHFATLPQDLEDTPGTVSEVYSGPVADALAAFLDTLPATVYADESGYIIGESEPEGYEEDGEFFEPESYWQIDRREIVRALFNRLIADEFM
jgi:hypothetical protein